MAQAACGPPPFRRTRHALRGPIMLMVREPRTFLWPWREPGNAGGVVEAIFGVCVPERKADLDFRHTFSKAWGILPDGFQRLHGRLENLVRVVAKIAAVAHHRPLACEDPDIPKTWNVFEGALFPTKASMLVIEKLLEPADVSILETAGCALCALSKDLTGSEVGLSIPGQEP